jgi:hypothetical protein
VCWPRDAAGPHPVDRGGLLEDGSYISFARRRSVHQLQIDY